MVDFSAETRQTLEDLELIARIPPYSKLVVQSRCYLFVGSVISRAWVFVQRHAMGETGEDTDKFINAVFDRSLSIMRSEPKYKILIAEKMEACLPGLKNLISVYKSNADVSAKLETTLLRLRPDLMREDHSVAGGSRPDPHQSLQEAHDSR